MSVYCPESGSWLCNGTPWCDCIRYLATLYVGAPVKAYVDPGLTGRIVEISDQGFTVRWETETVAFFTWRDAACYVMLR